MWVGFEVFQFEHVAAIKATLEGVGFGFGHQGRSAGRFYDLPDPQMPPPIPILSNEPR